MYALENILRKLWSLKAGGVYKLPIFGNFFVATFPLPWITFSYSIQRWQHAGRAWRSSATLKATLVQHRLPQWNSL